MKNITKQRNLYNEPSKKTRWAYWMQAIEPTSEAINKAFPGYHPQWVQVTQKMTIGAENFMLLRLLLGMTPEQCAAYLRTTTKTVQRWESGFTPVPFAEFELMRMVLESVSFKTSHPEWDGWFISNDGKLVSPHEGNRCYTPDDLKLFTHTINGSSRLASEVRRLEKELEAAVEENTRLRQMFLSQGVVDELAAMHDKLSKLMDSIGTAHVIPFPSSGSEQIEQPQERAA